MAVRPINKDILGMEGADNLIRQTIPSISTIAPSSFRPGIVTTPLQFTSAPGAVGRLGIFAAKKGNSERAVILLLPEGGTPDRVLVCITQEFAQAADTLDPLGWQNPLSPPFIKFCLLKHVINRWGAQMLASGKQMAFVYIVRAKGDELGPFANDGAFVRQTLDEMASLTDDAFSADHVEAFTFSSGISDFNTFVSSLGGQLSVEKVYAIDPADAAPASVPNGASRKQYLSGQTGGPKPGFEWLPLDRWVNEWSFPMRTTFKKPWMFNYLHNHTMPMYVLNLALQTS